MDVLLRVIRTFEVCVTRFVKDKWMSVHPKIMSVMALGCLVYIPLQLRDQGWGGL